MTLKLETMTENVWKFCILMGFWLVAAAAEVCYMGKQLDSTGLMRWSLPYSDPCICTKILLGGLNTHPVFTYEAYTSIDDPIIYMTLSEQDIKHNFSCKTLAYEDITPQARLTTKASTNHQISTTLTSDTRRTITTTEKTTTGSATSNIRPSTITTDAKVSDTIASEATPTMMTTGMTSSRPVPDPSSAICQAYGVVLDEVTIANNFSGDCTDYLGMKSGYILDEQITASSYNGNRSPSLARLHGNGFWSANMTDKAPWIQADLQEPKRVSGIITQGDGRPNHPDWVTFLSVAFTNDTSNDPSWNTFHYDNCTEIIFKANEDINTEKKIVFPVPVTAQILRIKPISWIGFNIKNNKTHANCQMRFEIIGCN
ncbi:uncharacterized protein [Amphiura filiformis]|uniref:uncharacterized protein n=1 Tax=Amphiura filiformis TaxID=82378 RepID=UPI003B2275D2